MASHNLALVFHVSALDWKNYSVTNGEVEAEPTRRFLTLLERRFNRWERLATDEEVMGASHGANSPVERTRSAYGFCASDARDAAGDWTRSMRTRRSIRRAGKIGRSTSGHPVHARNEPGLDNVENTAGVGFDTGQKAD